PGVRGTDPRFLGAGPIACHDLHGAGRHKPARTPWRAEAGGRLIPRTWSTSRAIASYVIGTGQEDRSGEPSCQSRSSTQAIPSTSPESRTTAPRRVPSTAAALPAGATTSVGTPIATDS